MAGDNPETNPITIKPETVSHVAEQFSWVLLPYCSPPGCPFPIKSLALSADVSPRTIHFRVLDKSPVSGPGRGPPSCNKIIKNRRNTHKLQQYKISNVLLLPGNHLGEFFSYSLLPWSPHLEPDTMRLPARKWKSLSQLVLRNLSETLCSLLSAVCLSLSIPPPLDDPSLPFSDLPTSPLIWLREALSTT